MPPGVASHFMDLLGADRRAAKRQTIVMAVLSILLAAPAYLIWPWEGLLAHVGALFVGLAVGSVIARRRATRYETSLRATWTQWMRFSVASESVPEIYRRVSGKSSRNLPYKFAIALVVAWALEVLLLVIAFQDETTMMAIPVIAYNGLLAAGLMAYFIHRARWTKEFGQSVKELVESGEIGLWGVL